MNINWGIIGCGDVTEIKSGPAFYKVAGSSLYAVMRRDASKAADYAARHQVPVFYTDALQLIQDVNVQAIYIATPPDSHEAYALAAIDAGKPVYLEKPMTLNCASAKKITAYAHQKGVKLAVAHYRNAQPFFLKVQQLLAQKAIGQVVTVHIEYNRKPPSEKEMCSPGMIWRLNPKQSGGGLFHDLAPHQLGLMQFFFGNPLQLQGYSSQHNKSINADDVVTGTAIFPNNIHFTGVWNFNAAHFQEKDICIIQGTKGSISFAIFGNTPIRLINELNEEQLINFPLLPHVQQPMIERVVTYFAGTSSNPCTPESAVTVMEMIDAFTQTTNSTPSM